MWTHAVALRVTPSSSIEMIAGTAVANIDSSQFTQVVCTRKH